MTRQEDVRREHGNNPGMSMEVWIRMPWRAVSLATRATLATVSIGSRADGASHLSHPASCPPHWSTSIPNFCTIGNSPAMEGTLLCKMSSKYSLKHRDRAVYYSHRHCGSIYPEFSLRSSETHPLLNHFRKVIVFQPLPDPAVGSTCCSRLVNSPESIKHGWLPFFSTVPWYRHVLREIGWHLPLVS